jgi:hypothetical protein
MMKGEIEKRHRALECCLRPPVSRRLRGVSSSAPTAALGPLKETSIVTTGVALLTGEQPNSERNVFDRFDDDGVRLMDRYDDRRCLFPRASPSGSNFLVRVPR